MVITGITLNLSTLLFCSFLSFLFRSASSHTSYPENLVCSSDAVALTSVSG